MAWATAGESFAQSGDEPPPPPELKTVLRDIDWDALADAEKARAQRVADTSEDAPAPAVLSARETAEADRTRLPILLPELPVAAVESTESDAPRSVRLVPKQNFYVASFLLPDASVEVFGTRQSRIVKTPDRFLPAAETLRQRKGTASAKP